jgi:hypothetical protein
MSLARYCNNANRAQPNDHPSANRADAIGHQWITTCFLRTTANGNLAAANLFTAKLLVQNGLLGFRPAVPTGVDKRGLRKLNEGSDTTQHNTVRGQTEFDDFPI